MLSIIREVCFFSGICLNTSMHHYFVTANHLVGDLVKYASNKKFTHLVILTEKQKACNGLVDHCASVVYVSQFVLLTLAASHCSLLISHLPNGPTAFFKVRRNRMFHSTECLCVISCCSQLSSFEAGAQIPGHGRPTSHIPEIILNNFGTRLGRRTGRFLGSLFPHVSRYTSWWSV